MRETLKYFRILAVVAQFAACFVPSAVCIIQVIA